MPTKIVVHDQLPFEEKSIELIRRTAPAAQVVVATQEQLPAELVDAEIFFGFHLPDVFRVARQLRWIQTTAAGLDKLLVPELVARNFIITNASGVHAPQVVEMAWALTLTVARRMPTFFARQQAHRWQWELPYDLDGSTAGIIGLGGIGRRYASIAAAFGMRVLAVDLHSPPQSDSVAAVWKMDRLDDLLAQSDVVLVSCPYTPETRYLINRQRLDQMKPTAILVNIARGGIVDENALADALRSGRLAGAGLDVVETEPLPSESPLWDVPNLVITPHSAGLSPRRMHRLAEFFCQNLQRYLSGQPLQNVVDCQRGYPVPA